MRIDVFDVVTLAGLALLAVGVWMLAGWPALVACVGALLVAVGILGAMRAGRI